MLKAPTYLVLFKAPTYLVDAAKKKYGKKITVIGATKENIDNFWLQVHSRVDPGHEISRPVQKSKTVVAIDSKTHSNCSTKHMEDGPQGTKKKSDDWYDAFEITSRKSTGESKSKKYNLHLAKTSKYEVGGSLNIGAEFFNIVAGVSVKGKYSKEKTKTEDHSESSEESLSQAYEVVDILKVPPKTKAKAKITTYAVTYKCDTFTRITVDAKAYIEVIYATYFSNLLGKFLKSTGFVTAEDIFEGEDNYEEIDGNVTFTRDGEVSYLGEEIEIHKTIIPLQYL